MLTAPWVTRHAGSLYPVFRDPAAGALMRKPADFDDQIKALQDGDESLKEQENSPLGALVPATKAGAFGVEELAGFPLTTVA